MNMDDFDVYGDVCFDVLPIGVMKMNLIFDVLLADVGLSSKGALIKKRAHKSESIEDSHKEHNEIVSFIMGIAVNMGIEIKAPHCYEEKIKQMINQYLPKKHCQFIAKMSLCKRRLDCVLVLITSANL